MRVSRFLEFGFELYLLLAICICIIILTALLTSVVVKGINRLTLNLFTNYPSSNAEEAGMRSAILGSLYTVGLSILIAFPLGVAIGLYISEYASNNKLKDLVQIMLVNLSGTPSIIFGLVALSILSYTLGLGRSIIVGSIALAFLTLPLITVSTIEGARLVPNSQRFGAYALGAYKYQVVLRIVLPRILPTILTTSILAISRALGEAAPMLVISGLVFIVRDPVSLLDEFTVMPLQIYNWVSRPQEAFVELSAAAIIVLLIILLALNLCAIYLRNRLYRRFLE